MSKKYVGTVVDRKPAGRGAALRNILVEVKGQATPKVGDNVTLTITYTDEQIGKKLREMFDDVEADSITDLCDNISNYAGWPALADLIKDVAL